MCGQTYALALYCKLILYSVDKESACLLLLEVVLEFSLSLLPVFIPVADTGLVSKTRSTGLLLLCEVHIYVTVFIIN